MARREIRTLEQARLTSPLVRAVMATGGTAEDCCVVLLNALDAAIEKATRLDWIAPKKVRLHNGQVFVWHCPDYLVPDPEEVDMAVTVKGERTRVTVERPNGERLSLRGEVVVSGREGQSPVEVNIRVETSHMRTDLHTPPHFADRDLAALFAAARAEGAVQADFMALADRLGECDPADRLAFVKFLMG